MYCCSSPEREKPEDKPSAESKQGSPAVADDALPDDASPSKKTIDQTFPESSKNISQLGSGPGTSSAVAEKKDGELRPDERTSHSNSSGSSEEESEEEQGASPKGSRKKQSAGEESRRKEPSGEVNRKRRPMSSRGRCCPVDPLIGSRGCPVHPPDFPGNQGICITYARDANPYALAGDLRQLKAGVTFVMAEATTEEGAVAAVAKVKKYLKKPTVVKWPGGARVPECKFKVLSEDSRRKWPSLFASRSSCVHDVNHCVSYRTPDDRYLHIVHFNFRASFSGVPHWIMALLELPGTAVADEDSEVTPWKELAAALCGWGLRIIVGHLNKKTTLW